MDQNRKLAKTAFHDRRGYFGDINVTGYWLGISYTCTALRYKPAFIATW